MALKFKITELSNYHIFTIYFLIIIVRIYIKHYLNQGGFSMTVASQVKQTLASLKNAQSTLRLYAVQSQGQEDVDILRETLMVTNNIIKDLENRIKVLEMEEPQYKGS